MDTRGFSGDVASMAEAQKRRHTTRKSRTELKAQQEVATVLQEEILQFRTQLNHRQKACTHSYRDNARALRATADAILNGPEGVEAVVQQSRYVRRQMLVVQSELDAQSEKEAKRMSQTKKRQTAATQQHRQAAIARKNAAAHPISTKDTYTVDECTVKIANINGGPFLGRAVSKLAAGAASPSVARLGGVDVSEQLLHNYFEEHFGPVIAVTLHAKPHESGNAWAVLSFATTTATINCLTDEIAQQANIAPFSLVLATMETPRDRSLAVVSDLHMSRVSSRLEAEEIRFEIANRAKKAVAKEDRENAEQEAWSQVCALSPTGATTILLHLDIHTCSTCPGSQDY